jgi:hypothetical protein
MIDQFTAYYLLEEHRNRNRNRIGSAKTAEIFEENKLLAIIMT